MKVFTVKDIPHGFSIGLVVSRYHTEITDKMLQDALARLAELECQEDRVTVVRVAGAIEIPSAVDALLKNGCAEVVIALGCVISGETTHYDNVCDIVMHGCGRLALDYHVPVIQGLLTVESERQAYDRLSGGKKGNRAREAVDTAYEMVSISKQLGGEIA